MFNNEIYDSLSNQNDLSITFKPTLAACTVDHCHIDIVITLRLSHDYYIVRYEQLSHIMDYRITK